MIEVATFEDSGEGAYTLEVVAAGGPTVSTETSIPAESEPGDTTTITETPATTAGVIPTRRDSFLARERWARR